MYVTIRGGYVNVKNNRLKQNKQRMTGFAKKEVIADVLEDKRVEKLTDNLKNIRVSKPRFPQKYISFT